MQSITAASEGCVLPQHCGDSARSTIYTAARGGCSSAAGAPTMLTGIWAPGPGTVPQRATLPNSMHIRTLGVRAGGAIHSRSRRRRSWRNFNHLFGVCATRVFPAWCGRGPNHRPPLVPRRKVSCVGAASCRVTGRRPDRNLVVGAAVCPVGSGPSSGASGALN